MLAVGELHQYLLTLGRGISILSLKPATVNPQLVATLYRNDFFGRPSLKSLVDCLRTSHQVISRFEAAKIAAVAVGRSAVPNWDDCTAVMRGLQELGLVSARDSDGETWELNRDMIRAAKLTYGEMSRNATQLLIRERLRLLLIKQVAEWLSMNRFVSANGTKFIASGTPIVSFGGIPFDILGFSYARGLANVGDGDGSPRNTPMLGDCLIEECNKPYAESLLRLVRQASSKVSRNGQRVIPFIFAQRFEPEAFKFLTKEQILTWTHGQLIGKKTAEAVQRILEITQRILAYQELSPEMFFAMFEGFEDFPTLFGGLKGKMFELLMAYYFQKRSNEVRFGWLIQRAWIGDFATPAPVITGILDDLDANEEEDEEEDSTNIVYVSESSDEYDVDIVAFRSDEAAIVECKGIASDKSVDDSEVKKHFTQRTPLVRALLSKEHSRKLQKYKSIVITTGGFEDVTEKKIRYDQYKGRPDTELELWDRERLLSHFQQQAEKELVEIVDRFYK